jgi:signal transduction histidine kinase
MTLARRNLIAALALALPAAAIVVMVMGWIDRRDRAALLERAAESFLNEVVRDACVNDAQWFLAGPRTGRPRPEERLQPDADVRLPRPSAEPLPFEYFAYDEEYTPRSVAGPRFPDELKRRMRSSPPERLVTSQFTNALGSGIQTAIATNWTPGPCSVLLLRQIEPPGRPTMRGFLFVGAYGLFALVAWLVAAPVAARVRKLSKQAKDSTREGYGAMVDIRGSDEISSLGAVFNDSAADIRRKATDAKDREEALRRYVEHATEDIAPPLTALERTLVEAAARHGDDRLRQAVRETHRLAMSVRNQAAVTRLRGVTDSSPREDVDLAEVVRDVAATRRALADVSGVTIDASKAGTPTLVKADRALLEQAVANLLDNAIVYNRPGGSVRVELASYDHGRRFRLLVADNGPGVSDDEFAGLTANKRFRGDESRTRRPGGRGLGLAIAREVADRFGMQLDLRQPAGGGFEAEIATRT